MCSRDPRAPHTPFSTEFRGGAAAVKRRLDNLFHGPAAGRRAWSWS